MIIRKEQYYYGVIPDWGGNSRLWVVCVTVCVVIPVCGWLLDLAGNQGCNSRLWAVSITLTPPQFPWKCAASPRELFSRTSCFWAGRQRRNAAGTRVSGMLLDPETTACACGQRTDLSLTAMPAGKSVSEQSATAPTLRRSPIWSATARASVVQARSIAAREVRRSAPPPCFLVGRVAPLKPRTGRVMCSLKVTQGNAFLRKTYRFPLRRSNETTTLCFGRLMLSNC